MELKHKMAVRLRWFRIWQELGYNPWRKEKPKKEKKHSGDFYKGAFDSIPFLNDDAKRTFAHLLLRPGYMIRDYINGQHDRYLAPIMALIIFYAFFGLMSSILAPIQHEKEALAKIAEASNVEVEGMENERARQIFDNTVSIVQKGYIYLHLDKYPDEVKTQHEAAIAAVENTLRNQGITLFIGEFLLLWLSLAISLRKFKLGMSAYAATAAYVLCQFSFFMLFALLLTWGESTSISALLMLLLLTIDLRQMLNLTIGKSIGRAVITGVWYGLLYLGIILIVSLVTLVIAFFLL